MGGLPAGYSGWVRSLVPVRWEIEVCIVGGVIELLRTGLRSGSVGREGVGGSSGREYICVMGKTGILVKQF